MNFPLQLQRFSIGECELDLFVPDRNAVKAAYQNGTIPFPYWSQVWPSAKALAEFLVQYPSYTKDKLVLELGAGLGLPSLVAAHYATGVLCTDNIPEAVEIAAQSAAVTGLKNFTASVFDWRYLPPGLEADVLLLSDINYEPDAFALLKEVVQTFLSGGTTILLSTPQRLMAKEFIMPLLGHCTQQNEMIVWHEGENVAISVLVLKK